MLEKINEEKSDYQKSKQEMDQVNQSLKSLKQKEQKAYEEEQERLKALKEKEAEDLRKEEMFQRDKTNLQSELQRIRNNKALEVLHEL